ncbi:ciliated left-right organizer metallopeptidase [Latimeria chalumnae]|uniref:ciliated left-right organizer metallopeptidase n=1 Tax=Latimeria chalumnae TaxID=7897 RepID=UPI0003C14558|nr:PREDICTED: leishmanolysin homolog [Latimeria chalumnae]|eukprot:XP_005994482.1 PREDICTED: leishmanolysin homolog [Latimeria chalumnae]
MPPALMTSLFLLLLIGAPLCTGKCIHEEVQRGITVVTQPRQGFVIASPRPRALRAPSGGLLPIRIRTSYPTVKYTTMTVEEKARLNTSVEEAISILANMLAVNRVPGTLLLSRDINKYCRFIWKNPEFPNYNKCSREDDNYRTETCLDVTIPDDHLAGYAIWDKDGNSPTQVRPDGAGVKDADFILYVKAANTEKCLSEPSVIAYASYCQVDDTDRPIAGVVVFCHARLSNAEFNREKTVLTTVHELLHALGFSKDLFEKWKDCTLAPSIGVNCSVRSQVTNSDGMNQVRIFTQNLIQKMKEHLGSDLDELGGPLENKDREGLASSHWEARFLQGSIMTAAFEDPRLTQIDEITLAAMSDTGWYQVNYSAVESLVWGKAQGSSFGLRATCSDNSSQYFCQGSGFGCHYLHLHKGVCETDPFLEGCRMFKPIANGSECWIEANHNYAANHSTFGEVYHADSRCFFSNLTAEHSTPSADTMESLTGRCYLHRCIGENNFQVKVEGSPWLNCTAGSAIEVPGYRGVLLCPDGRLCQNFNHSLLFSLDKPALVTAVPSGSGSTGLTTPERNSNSKGSNTVEVNSSITVVIVYERLERSSTSLSDVESRQFVEAALMGLADAAGIHSCHFQNPSLSDDMTLTVELREFLGCRVPSLILTYQQLQKVVESRRVILNFHNYSYKAVSIRMVGETPPTLPPPDGRIIAAIVCTCIGGLLVLTIAALLIYRKHRLTMGRVHATYQSSQGRLPPALKAV